MSPSQRERAEHHQRLRRVQRKLEEHQALIEETDDAHRPCGKQAWHDLVEQRIQDAMADGAFDNLPGEGKPLNLNHNAYLDPSLELAYGLLKNNGFMPEWIARDKEIRLELEVARARLRASWARHQANSTDETAWQTALTLFEETLSQLNRKIDDLNLIVPVSSCQRVRLRLADELRRLDHE
jgi:DnaJ family protein C protein 28